MPDTSQFLAMPNAAVDEADILILPIPLERTVSFKPGTADAPAAILETTAFGFPHFAGGDDQAGIVAGLEQEV